MPFHSDSPRGATAAYSVCDGLRKEENTEGGSKLRSNFKPFVHEILELCRGPLHSTTSLSDCLYVVFYSDIGHAFSNRTFKSPLAAGIILF